MKTIIIDDEHLCTNLIKNYLEASFPEFEILAICNNPLEGLKCINEMKPELVFLDIDMPKLNGFQLLDKVKQINFNLVFATAYNEYALKAFKYSAIDYLLKPISKIDFNETVERIISRKAPVDIAQTNYLHDIQSNGELNKIAISNQEGVVFLNIDEIVTCESNGNYTTIIMQNGEKILASKILKEFDEMLKTRNFIRVHQSYLVNVKYIKKYLSQDGGELLLTTGSFIPVSRFKKSELLALFNTK
jgi:two-component system, LytTR family, response regulator